MLDDPKYKTAITAESDALSELDKAEDFAISCFNSLKNAEEVLDEWNKVKEAIDNARKDFEVAKKAKEAAQEAVDNAEKELSQAKQEYDTVIAEEDALTKSEVLRQKAFTHFDQELIDTGKRLRELSDEIDEMSGTQRLLKGQKAVGERDRLEWLCRDLEKNRLNAKIAIDGASQRIKALKSGIIPQKKGAVTQKENDRDIKKTALVAATVAYTASEAKKMAMPVLDLVEGARQVVALNALKATAGTADLAYKAKLKNYLTAVENTRKVRYEIKKG